MKKLIAFLLALAAAVIAACAATKGLEAVNKNNNGDNSEYDYEDHYYDNDRDPDVDYYGCPNSKRVRKLNLIKNRMKRHSIR